jgi:hypothetical protein
MLAAGRTCWPSNHRIPVRRGHLPGLDDVGMDPTPALYAIRIRGHLGSTLLSAFPELLPRRHGARTVLTGLLDRRCTACWSRSESSPQAANHQNQMTAAHLDGHELRPHPVSASKKEEQCYGQVSIQLSIARAYASR